ncbi:hypothetical protein AO354_46785 [Pseudomonas syringae pv. syringae]|nr:hypothetical protein AO354_46785 [Pseudomonas syringae pv. syringae]
MLVSIKDAKNLIKRFPASQLLRVKSFSVINNAYRRRSTVPAYANICCVYFIMIFYFCKVQWLSLASFAYN